MIGQILIEIVEEAGESLLAHGGETGAGDADPAKGRRLERQAQRRDGRAAAELRSYQVALEIGFLEVNAGFDIFQEAPAHRPARAVFGGITVVEAGRRVDLPGAVVDGEMRGVVDERPARVAEQRNRNLISAA